MADEVAPIEMGERRAGMAAAAMDDRIYIFGGHNGDTHLKLAEVFEPGDELTDRGYWARLPPMHARRSHCSATAFGGMIFVIGGTADGRVLNTFEVYDPRKSEWALWFTKPPMQTKRSMHSSIVEDGRLLVCGGMEGIRDLNLVEEFEQSANAWVYRDKMETGRSYFALAAVNKNLYAIGGQDRRKADMEDIDRAHRSVERFELWSERWYPCAPLLQGRVGLAAATLMDENGEDFIYACGGSDGSAVLASMERYDPRTDTWTEAPPMQVQRLGHAVAVVGNRLYAIGGLDGKEPLDTFECFDPVLNKWGPLLKMGALPEEVEDAED